MKMMMKLIILNSVMTPLLKHPMSLGTMLMMQMMLLMLFTTKMTSNSWYMYILFITIISGLMVMFMYMSSIASNEKFNMKKKTMKIYFVLTMIMILLPMLMMMKYDMNVIFCNLSEEKMFFMEYEQILSTSKFFNLYKMNLTIMLLFILILTMITISVISNNFEGPLKKTYV
nr:NADH dehydrogenase subunit 6 [Tettigometridae sp.]